MTRAARGGLPSVDGTVRAARHACSMASGRRATASRGSAIARTRLGLRAFLPLVAALAAGAAAAILLLAAPARAGVHSLNFDSVAAGTTINSGPAGLTMPQNPVTFNASGKTQSNPNALRMPGNCPSSGQICTTNDNLLDLRFSNPVRSVSVRTGVVVPTTCFEFDCPEIKLVGFNSSGGVVASSAPEFVANPSLTFPLAIDAFEHVITRAVLGVAEDPEDNSKLFGAQWTAQIDNLNYDVFEPGDPPPPPPPGRPSVTISSPSGDETFATTDVAVGGRVSAPAGLADFCAVANAPAGFPADCARTAAVRADGSFSLSRIPGVRPGTNVIRVWARDTLRRTASDVISVEVAAGDVDYRAETLEVTQAVQTGALPSPGSLSIPRLGTRVGATYDGVPLATGKRTIVRLFGAAQGAPSPVRGVTALLHGYRRRADGTLRERSSSPIRPLNASPTPLAADPDIAVQRADPQGAFNFLLPPEWIGDGELVLEGEVAPASVSTAARECCRANNSFFLDGIEFTRVRPLTVWAAGLRWTRGDGTISRPPDPLPSYFEDMRAVWPGPLAVFDTGREFDVTDAVNDPDVDARDTGNAQLYEAFEDTAPPAKAVGLAADGLGGGKGPGPTAATDTIGAGLDFVAHETGHATGLAHAHSPENQHDGEPDPRDHPCAAHDGAINGVGIDPRIWSGPDIGTFGLIGAETPGVFDATPDAPAAVYDYMSYCSNEGMGATWIATGYWANQVRELVTGGRLITDFTRGCCFLGAAADPTVRRAEAGRSTTTAKGTPIVRVGAVLDGGQPASILRVEPDRGTADPPAPGSDVTVIVRDASGAEISRTPVAAQASEERPAPGAASSPASRLVNAAVPGGGAARVEIEVGGVVVGSRTASAKAPRAKLKRPKSRARIPAKGRFAVEWTAGDADGDALKTKIQFSSDRGRSWQTLALGVEGRRARVDGSLLPQTRNGMLRIAVSDGFNVARSVARRLRAAGGRPQVEITAPGGGRRTTLLGDATIVLEGTGVDATGKPLVSKRLVWKSKGKRLGRGERIGVPAYRLGRTVTLTGRDRSGARGKDKARFKIRKVAPLFTTLDAKQLRAKARKLELRLASSLPGKLIAGGKGLKRARVRVGPATKTVKVATKGRRRGNYAVKLKLMSQGRTTREKRGVNRAG
jgi:hypothetical protein